MARLPFSLLKQGAYEYEVKDIDARSDIVNLKDAVNNLKGDYTFLQLAGSQSPATITIPQGAIELFVLAAAASDNSFAVCHGSLPIEVAKKYASNVTKWAFWNNDGATRYLVNVDVSNIANNKITISWSNCSSPAIFYK